MSKSIGEVLIPRHYWAEIESTLQHNSTYFVMILNHNKFTINVGWVINVTVT
jgi:hypothetical protein